MESSNVFISYSTVNYADFHLSDQFTFSFSFSWEFFTGKYYMYHVKRFKIDNYVTCTGKAIK